MSRLDSLDLIHFVAHQGAPDHLLPDALTNDNPLGIYRMVNGELTKACIQGVTH